VENINEIYLTGLDFVWLVIENMTELIFIKDVSRGIRGLN
jgi:hypothetical protein